ncbi:tryptophan--tRNA ligase, partial [Candidatus Saccharibacteria bacterium]|nr:tryptophan--tRNA ligase [Candidatus Saccharibacteria bacterium]
MNKPTILTGLRANNDLTIGNYLGAMVPMIEMATTQSTQYQINMFVPDLHSFTTPIDYSKLKEQTLHNLKLFIASGLPLDNPNIHIYRQSYIPAHSELTWILDCFTGFGEMSRMTQFKDKSSKINEDRISVGLFNYPVLMAVDILLYDALLVPVGDDQTQHLEFARDIAQRLNTMFTKDSPDPLFTIPLPVSKQHEFFGKGQGLRIMDLQDPTKKMSKSDEIGKGVIFLGDTPEQATKKIMSATTDSIGLIKYDRTSQPGITNLIDIYALLSHIPVEQAIDQWENQTSYGDLKKATAQAVSDFLTTLQANLMAVDAQTVLTKLEESEALMNKIANDKL